MAIFAVEGRFGGGKSALASFLAVTMAAERGCGLYANYHLQGATPVRYIAELYDIWDSILVLDELQATVDSRGAMSRSNAEFLEWFDQSRKQGNELFVISQALHKLDRRVRDMVDILFVCRNLGGTISAVDVWDAAVERCVSRLTIDRSWAFGLYNHRERAWALLPGSPAAAAAGERARSARALGVR
ncbi:zonular occludens toxin domain-containing protein [Kallotenue papyrolyticum]|uniref:zonular occludens toxin domain-containing protein n=1 Tax=Kallotenue papyrolyticum TaxID=1325125 RepID=UPI000492B785|nr:zonular occludens toxin domain-containing protein [Kallotenue papyrolyticum]